jgi:hypothetical protein
MAWYSDTSKKTKRIKDLLQRVRPMTLRQLAKRTAQNDAQPYVARMLRVIGLCSVWVALLCTGWSPTVAAPFGAYGPPTVQARDTGATSGLRQRQLEFLHRLRQADPRYQTIEKAVLNEQNELGVILNRQVEMSAVRPLMRTILTQMAREFPGQDLTVIAYAPTQPPMQIGTARLHARTRQMTYTPAVSQ